MPVTEFAVLQLRAGHDETKLLEALARCRERQDEWMRRHQPRGIGPGTSLSSMYLDRAGPEAASLLITAPWDSPQAHAEWIGSEANRACNDELSGYVADGADAVRLFHMAAAGRRAQIRGAFMPGPAVFNVDQLSVEPGGRDAMQEAYRTLEDALVGRREQDQVWAGWAVEKTGEEDTLVVFWGDGVSGEHVNRLVDASAGRHHGRFRHVV